MGGYGSGRSWGGGRCTVEGRRSIDVRRWKSDGLLEPGQSFGWQWSNDEGEQLASISVRVKGPEVILTYRQKRYWDDDWTDVEQAVPLQWTPCHLGGRRPWFRCDVWSNGVYCGRRVAKLYLGETLFACRSCYGLAYESQREDRTSRATSKAQKIRNKLAGSVSLFDPFPEKPKHMHWKTYWRMRQAAKEAEYRSCMGLAQKYNLNLDRH